MKNEKNPYLRYLALEVIPMKFNEINQSTIFFSPNEFKDKTDYIGMFDYEEESENFLSIHSSEKKKIT